MRFSDRRVLIGAAVAVLAAIWFLWPSSLSRVTNLDSAGSSVITYGDSLTAGVGAQEGEDYPSRVSAMVGVPLLNAGVSGDTTEAALARIEDDVLSQSPRIVIVGLGGNDFLRRVEIRLDHIISMRKFEVDGSVPAQGSPLY